MRLSLYTSISNYSRHVWAQNYKNMSLAWSRRQLPDHLKLSRIKSRIAVCLTRYDPYFTRSPNPAPKIRPPVKTDTQRGETSGGIFSSNEILPITLDNLKDSHENSWISITEFRTGQNLEEVPVNYLHMTESTQNTHSPLQHLELYIYNDSCEVLWEVKDGNGTDDVPAG